jgi:RNA polymerase sigma-70 factor (ECF subfamily)
MGSPASHRPAAGGDWSSEGHPFHRLLGPETASLRTVARRLTRNDHRAQDLVQETLTKAWANRGRFQAGTQLRAWLYTILRNSFLSDLRKHRREVEDVDGGFSARLSEGPAQEHAYALEELRAAIDTLPESQRDALMLVGGAGYSHEAAARRCDCAVGTVKSRVSRARTRLNEILERDAAVA